MSGIYPTWTDQGPHERQMQGVRSRISVQKLFEFDASHESQRPGGVVTQRTWVASTSRMEARCVGESLRSPERGPPEDLASAR